MRRKRIVLLGMIVMLAVSLGLFNGFASAAADLVKGDIGFSLFDGDGNLIPCEGIKITTNNKKGTQLVTCHAQGANSTGRAVHWDFDNTGFTCGGSTKWKITVSRTGRATLHCNF